MFMKVNPQFVRCKKVSDQASQITQMPLQEYLEKMIENTTGGQKKR